MGGESLSCFDFVAPPRFALLFGLALLQLAQPQPSPVSTGKP